MSFYVITDQRETGKRATIYTRNVRKLDNIFDVTCTCILRSLACEQSCLIDKMSWVVWRVATMGSDVAETLNNRFWLCEIKDWIKMKECWLKYTGSCSPLHLSRVRAVHRDVVYMAEPRNNTRSELLVLCLIQSRILIKIHGCIF